jgi:hypothetical protein
MVAHINAANKEIATKSSRSIVYERIMIPKKIKLIMSIVVFMRA